EEEKKRGILQRSAVQNGPERVPPIVHEVLREPGRPLDTGTRTFFEHRFGHDFSGVRVHTDTKAAESARAVNAGAYVVGRNVVFSSGKYNPTTPTGRRLLAHELTHVVQQQAGIDAIHLAGPEHAAEQEADRNAQIAEGDGKMEAIERPPVMARETEVTVTVAPNGCSLDQHRQIFPAVMQAQRWLASSISELDAFLGAPAAPGLHAARNALDRHFHSISTSTASQVRARLDTLRTDMQSRTTLNVECHGASDRTCPDAGAYVNGSLLVFCPSFFRGGGLWQTEAVIHEMAHSLVGGSHITDRAYQSDRLYAQLTTAQALTNAESFGLFVQELGTGRAQISTAPQDTFEDCPRDWKPLIRQSIALAQRWNKNAQTSLGDRRPVWLSGWADLQNRYLGATTAASLDSAKGVIDKVENKLGSGVGFECEPDGGGRCDSAETYWYGIWSDFHICPSWKNQASDTARTQSLLAGLYGYLGDVENTRRWNLARLARELDSRFWP
ncbi:MAG: DUF4157 domain-containing protein, partial [Methanoregula sp.]